MDYLQVTLIIVLIILAANLTFVGVYLVLVLKNFLETVKKANRVLDDVGDVTGAVSGPVSTIAGFISGISESVRAVKGISSLIDNSKYKED
ncbi:hypothetical protein JXA34_03785 [Patescibacteria group bacterium]|nr:hypothetical protein [Patescibacteria group bacterium]